MVTTILRLISCLVLMRLLSHSIHLQLLIDIVLRIVSPICLLASSEVLLIALILHCLLLGDTRD